MIVVKLMGGLGNQLFQYATAKVLSKKLNCKVYFDLSFLKNFNSKNFTKRKYELDIYNLPITIIPKHELYIFFIKNIYNNIFIKKKYKNIKNKYINYTPIYDPNLIDLQSSTYLDGYFQSYKYFENIKLDLFNELNLFNFILEKDNLLNIYNEIKNCNSVSIHIRRGDYANNSHINNIHGTCSLKYYNEAINYIFKKHKNVKFYFFSDDINWCLENFHNSNFIFLNPSQIPSVDLYLMSNCYHNIISNSTFSWWSAWLNNNEMKDVIAPKKWFKNSMLNITTHDLCPPDWIRL
jgi:hypothetical protein